MVKSGGTVGASNAVPFTLPAAISVLLLRFFYDTKIPGDQSSTE